MGEKLFRSCFLSTLCWCGTNFEIYDCPSVRLYVYNSLRNTEQSLIKFNVEMWLSLSTSTSVFKDEAQTALFKDSVRTAQ